MSTLMSTPYFAILTRIGEAKLSQAIAQGTTLKLTDIGVGDGVGKGPDAIPIPTPDQTALLHECRRAPINQLFEDPQDPKHTHQIVVEQIIPEDEGGWWIREIGLYDDAGDLCAVASCPPSYKPKLAEGSGRTMVVRLILAVSSTKAVQLMIDPGVVLATRKHVDDSVQAVVETIKDYARLKSPHFMGTPTAATPPEADSSNRLATTAFVQGHAFAHAQWAVFTENDTFTVPEGVTRLWISACAGGGGGGGGGATSNTETGGYGGGGGGGGGAGESVLCKRYTVKPGDTLPIVIGKGGAGGSAGAFADETERTHHLSNGTPGGDTKIGSLLRLAGAEGGSTGAMINTPGNMRSGAGGNAGKGWPSGSFGGDGAFAGNGGPGGSSPFGGGGGAGRASIMGTSAQNGLAGSGYGSGGGGAGAAYHHASKRGGVGGNGAPGWVKIEW
ncbi:hypothetical protein BGZ81_003307 [Podila clonocystis]|nr:hypothetical protein BGZ81_003307 [Podila clonocystis]